MSENMYHTRCSELRKGKNERSRHKSKIVQDTARIGEDRNPMIRGNHLPEGRRQRALHRNAVC